MIPVSPIVRFMLLSALLARRELLLRAQWHHDRGAPNDHRVVTFMADTVSFYIRDLHDGKYKPTEQERL